ncbi:MAG: TetR-like C-terminal domain-containing protein [Bauldia sp.]
MPRAGLTPTAVVERAEAVADRDGLEAVTLARLASEFGVRSPSLYKHVEGLDGVRRALAVRGLIEANARIQRATVGKTRDEALLALARAYWQFARDRPGLYAASLRAPTPRQNDVAAAGEALLGTVLSVVASYGVSGDDALHATRGLRAIIHGFVSLDAAGGFRLKLDLEESFRRLLSAFARDLAARGPPA